MQGQMTNGMPTNGVPTNNGGVQPNNFANQPQANFAAQSQPNNFGGQMQPNSFNGQPQFQSSPMQNGMRGMNGATTQPNMTNGAVQPNGFNSAVQPNNGGTPVPMNQPNSVPAPTDSEAQDQPAPISAQQTALDALFSLDGGEAASAAPQSTSPAGNYNATLPGGASIRLTLNSDGTFRWIANKDGKATVGQGNYTLNAGAMKLVRTNDQQKLEGGFVPTANGFLLKVAGGKQSLNFVRV